MNQDSGLDPEEYQTNNVVKWAVREKKVFGFFLNFILHSDLLLPDYQN
jgi:hypothetical protein